MRILSELILNLVINLLNKFIKTEYCLFLLSVKGAGNSSVCFLTGLLLQGDTELSESVPP